MRTQKQLATIIVSCIVLLACGWHKRSATNQFHGDEVRIVHATELIKGDDVGVIECRRRNGLPVQSGSRLPQSGWARVVPSPCRLKECDSHEVGKAVVGTSFVWTFFFGPNRPPPVKS